MKRHTFVICAYKESPYLEQCIQSLLAQGIKSNIIIVTSTPNSYIEEKAKKYKLPYFINYGEGGITQDWNFGYSCAIQNYNSECITIAHQDDIYERNYLKNVLKYINGSKHTLIVFSDYYEIREGRRISRNTILSVKRIMLLPLRIKLFQKSIWMRRRILSLGSPICCPSVTFVAANLPKVIFENHFRACEDWEAWEKISKLKGQFAYIPEMLMGHRIHEGSETTASIDGNNRTKEEYKMFCKFWPKWFAKFLLKHYSKGQNFNQLS